MSNSNNQQIIYKDRYVFLIPVIVLWITLFIDVNNHLGEKKMEYNPDFYFAIAQGLVTNYAVKSLTGVNLEVLDDPGTLVGTKDLYTFPAAAAVVKVASTSNTDTASTAGAKKVLITGLDEDYEIITESVTLTGQTLATTTAEFLRINSVTVTEFGTGGSANVGTISVFTGTATTGIPDDDKLTLATIQPTANMSHSAVYTVPIRKTAYITKTFVVANGLNPITANLYVIPFSGAATSQVLLSVPAGGQVIYENTAPIIVAAKSDIYIHVVGTDDTDPSIVTGGFDFVEVTTPIVVPAATPNSIITPAAFATYLDEEEAASDETTLLMVGLNSDSVYPDSFWDAAIVSEFSGDYTDLTGVFNVDPKSVAFSKFFGSSYQVIDTAYPFVCFVWKCVDDAAATSYIKADMPIYKVSWNLMINLS